MRRGTVDTYPPFPRVICISGVDPGDPGGSSLGLGFDPRWRIPVISVNPERFLGENSVIHQISRSGLTMGDFPLVWVNPSSAKTGDLKVSEKDIELGKRIFVDDDNPEQNCIVGNLGNPFSAPLATILISTLN